MPNPQLTPQQYWSNPNAYRILRDPITGFPARNDQGYYPYYASGYPQAWWSTQDYASPGTPAPPFSEPTPIPSGGGVTAGGYQGMFGGMPWDYSGTPVAPWAEPSPIPSSGGIEATGFPGMFGTDIGQPTIGSGFDMVAPEGSVGTTVDVGLGGSVDQPTGQIDAGPPLDTSAISWGGIDPYLSSPNITEPTVELNPFDPTQVPSPQGWVDVNGQWMPPLAQPPDMPVDPTSGYAPPQPEGWSYGLPPLVQPPSQPPIGPTNYGGPGTFQMGTYIPTGVPVSMYGTNYGNGSFSFFGVPGTYQTTGSGETFLTAVGFSMDPNQQGDIYTGTGGEQFGGDATIYGIRPSRIPWLPGTPIFNPNNPYALAHPFGYNPTDTQMFGSVAPSKQDMGGVGGPRAK